jgi:hypothetical protein
MAGHKSIFKGEQCRPRGNVFSAGLIKGSAPELGMTWAIPGPKGWTAMAKQDEFLR